MDKKSPIYTMDYNIKSTELFDPTGSHAVSERKEPYVTCNARHTVVNSVLDTSLTMRFPMEVSKLLTPGVKVRITVQIME